MCLKEFQIPRILSSLGFHSFFYSFSYGCKYIFDLGLLLELFFSFPPINTLFTYPSSLKRKSLSDLPLPSRADLSEIFCFPGTLILPHFPQSSRRSAALLPHLEICKILAGRFLHLVASTVLILPESVSGAFCTSAFGFPPTNSGGGLIFHL